MDIILMDIGGYFVTSYSWLFHYKPLVIILLVVISEYFIGGY